MVEMMKLVDCHSAANPLIVAVDRSKVQEDSLTVGYANNPGDLEVIKFNSVGVVLELLAGMHRVKAARQASKELRVRFRHSLKWLDELQPLDNPHTVSAVNLSLVDALKTGIKSIKEVVEQIENWPVHFYDIGGLDPPHLRSVGKPADVVQGLLWELCTEIPLTSKKSGHNELLWYLAENTKERKGQKSSGETFSDIIMRFLYSPGKASNWKHLIRDNRVLNTICYRNLTWNLATTVIKVSPDMQGSWVLQAEPLFHLVSNPSSKVCIFDPGVRQS